MFFFHIAMAIFDMPHSGVELIFVLYICKPVKIMSVEMNLRQLKENFYGRYVDFCGKNSDWQQFL